MRYASLAVAAPWIFHPIRDLIPQLLCSCNVLLLIVTGIFQQYLVYQVQKIRLQDCYGYVHQYNSLNSQPDVLKSLYSPLQPSSSLEGLRYHDAGRLSDQQMALLQYQRENLHFLSEEILRLQECLSNYERTNDGSTPQVDLAHLLAARDQELRTVSAEMNQLQSELRLARSLIAERDSEIQKVRTTNNQYVEENERLRAILGEWSTRAAKLERALEAERMSNLELQKKIPTLRSQSQSSSEPTK
ncbi:FRIGIDA interacting protein 1 [Prunus dulcis]|uniref:FRIGIDA interacting protein 1 n=1 Tax=Prunus dulcis TaxID=3755 RepID=A0A4Y1RV33_PRUDU|nr:FRIGIDA interacting protein 1 [Prunus dulcis]